jgi:hypothetical protein
LDACECEYSDIEVRTHEKFWDDVSYERTLMDDAYRAGFAKGVAKAKAKAEAEAEERRKNALGMKQKGYPVADIAEITGLAAAEIEAL